jgi:hypothetical protein
MSGNGQNSKRNLSPDWLVQGILTKLGDMFDRLTGRGWKPSSTLATSELIERMKSLLDKEVRSNGDGRKFVPHNIKLKMQWDKFSTDSEVGLRKLENEFLIAAVDHINDRHYYTYAPLSIEVKPDYFTSGVKLFVSFEKFSETEHEAELSVSIPSGKDIAPTGRAMDAGPQLITAEVTASFSINGKEHVRVIKLEPGTRKSIGRTKENDLAIDDISVSKYHAALMIGDDQTLMIADTGSTNGTFVNGQRIAYGKAVKLGPEDKLKIGVVDISLSLVVAAPTQNAESDVKTDVYTVGEFSFAKPTTASWDDEERTGPTEGQANEPAPDPTVPAIAIKTPGSEESS